MSIRKMKKEIDAMDIPEEDKKKLWKKVLIFLLKAGIGLAGVFQIAEDVPNFLNYLLSIL